MKNDGLLPASWKKPAAVVFAGGIFWGALWLYSGAPEGGVKWFKFVVPALWSDGIMQESPAGPGWIANNITDELLLTWITLSGLVLGFSREPVEDEAIRQLRWKALARATWINALLFLGATWTIYGVPYFYIMYAQLVAFLLVFNVLLAVSLRNWYSLGHEE